MAPEPDNTQPNGVKKDPEPAVTALTPAAKPGPLVPTGEEFTVLMKMCEAFVEAKMLPGHFNTPAKALAAALRGRDLGIPPTTAWDQLYPVDNFNDQGEKTGVKMGMLVDIMVGIATSRIPGFFLDLKEVSVNAVEIWFHRPGWPVLKVRRTAEWAHKAGLPMKKDGKTMRANWARDFAGMLTARVTSIGLHKIAADVLAGLYPPDEIREYQEATAPRVIGGDLIDATNFKEVEE